MANGFIDKDQLLSFTNRNSEPTIHLLVGMDTDTKMVSLMRNFDKETLFGPTYPYRSSGSKTMRGHFKTVASVLS
ncbi:MAG: SAM-dependent methyltransferase, partial [Candidatus Thorarchaeota archaeon]